MPNLRRGENRHLSKKIKMGGTNPKLYPPLSEKDYWIAREDNLFSFLEQLT